MVFWELFQMKPQFSAQHTHARGVPRLLGLDSHLCMGALGPPSTVYTDLYHNVSLKGRCETTWPQNARHNEPADLGRADTICREAGVSQISTTGRLRRVPVELQFRRPCMGALVGE